MFPEIHYYRIYILSVSNVLKSIQDGFLHGRKKRGIREMEYKVGVISGDGIGPEIVTEAKKVLRQHIDFAVVSAAAGEETGGGTFKAPQGAEPVCQLKTGIFI